VVECCESVDPPTPLLLLLVGFESLLSYLLLLLVAWQIVLLHTFRVPLPMLSSLTKARLTNVFANHQNIARPKHRASVKWNLSCLNSCFTSAADKANCISIATLLRQPPTAATGGSLVVRTIRDATGYGVPTLVPACAFLLPLSWQNGRKPNLIA
jgi:hypothetical protein